MTSAIGFLRVSVTICAALAVPAATAATFTLSDLNSTAQFDPSSQMGQTSWVVDGTNHLVQQWFWYRVGETSREVSLDTLPYQARVQDNNFNAGLDTLYVQYTAPDFLATVGFVLTGGSPGSRTSDLMETISIKNTSGASLSFHFFEYVNFDLNGTAGDDTVQFTAANTVRQADPSWALSETVITPQSSHREAAFYNQTLAKLNDGAPTILDDNMGPLGPGDVTWCFEWDYVIAPQSTLIISKDKQITPEPSSLGLMLAAGLVWRRRR